MANEEINKTRVTFSVFFSLIGLIGIFVILKRHGFLLDMGPETVPSHIYRFIWSLFSAFLGFSALVFRIRRNPKPVIVSYFTYYIPLLIVIAALVTSITMLFDRLDGASFFYFSFSISFVLGVLVDSFFGFILSFISRFDETR
jgi:hypothetical protein